MSQQYLFGDSAPFPEQHNYLATIQGFVTFAGRAGQLLDEMRTKEQALAGTLVAKVKSLEELTKFCEGVIAQVRRLAAMSNDLTTVQPFAGQLIEYVQSVLDGANSGHARTIEDERTQLEADIRSRRADVRLCLESFLVRERLTVLSWTFEMRLIGDRADLSAVFESPGSITTAFELEGSRTTEWSGPRRVGDFAPGMEVQIGMRKSGLLRKSFRPEVVPIDNFLVSGVKLADDSAHIALRKRPDAARDTVVFHLERGSGQLIAQIERPDEDDGENSYSAAEGEDVGKLERLWTEVRAAAERVLTHRRRLKWLQLDGRDVIEHDLLDRFMERMIDQMAPLVTEIARRSPNPAELTLKLDRGDGRREEIYVTKEELAKQLVPLPEDLLRMFRRLDIFPAAWTQ